ncbi:hypothetical protein FACS1894202_09790 [Clostridia bacterium]|nr:hypothetical protein FACS1894202_09790 [Clostridia bacterium]
MLFSGSSGKISMQVPDGEEQFLAHTTSWSADSSLEIDEAAYFGGSLTQEGVTEKIPGNISWTASIDGSIDLDENSGQDPLFDAHNDKTLVTVRLYLDAATGFRGDGYIDSYSASDAADGKAEFSASIAGNGKLQRYTLGN